MINNHNSLSDSSDDSDYIPEEDQQSEELKDNSQLSIKSLRGNSYITNIWREMQAESLYKETRRTLSGLEDIQELARNIIKKQEDDIKNLRTVVFAGSEYLVDTNGTLRLKPETTAQIVDEKNTEEEEKIISKEEEEELDRKKRREYLKRIMEKLNRKNRNINSMRKSKMDWKQYARKENMEDKLQRNRENGLLKKKEFIKRVNERVCKGKNERKK